MAMICRSTTPKQIRYVFELLVAPAGMSIDAQGRIQWLTEPGVTLVNSVVVQVSDAFGATVLQSYTLNVTPDTTAPKLELQFSANPLVLGGTSIVVVQATDDVGIVELTLTRDGVPLVLDANRTVKLDGQQAGLFTIEATARDASGNVGQRQAVLRVFDPADSQGPVINLTSPQPGAVVTTLTDIVGSITDDNLQFYRIDYGRADLVDVNQPAADDPDYRTLASGNANAVDAVLATFDPTMLINDDHVIRILAQDLSGNVSAKTLPLSLDGQLKLGEFSLDFVDLNIPVAGIPITVTRSYDTRNANESGDFGFGWTLSVSDPQIRESIPVNPLEEDGLFFAATPFREGTRVYLTNPEGRRVGFTFRPQRQFSIFGGGSFSATFVPDPGVYDRLDVGQPQLRKVGDGFYNGFFGDPFNPSAYRLTTKDGTVYEYGQFGGLDNIQDRNGNRIDIRPDGIFSSLGPSIQFSRDPAGKISQMTDPVGNSIQYQYDLQGHLNEVTDRTGATTRYQYATNIEPGYLVSITDSLGNKVLRNSYDAIGRVVESRDAVDNVGTQSYDTTNRIHRVVDARGNIYEQQLDTRGNIILAKDKIGAITHYVYEDPSNPDLETAITDPLGRTTRFRYDSDGNRIETIDMLHGVRRSTYSSQGEVISESDTLGRTKTMIYDDYGNLVRIVDGGGGVTRYAYDDQGRMMLAVDDLGRESQLTYSEQFLPSASTRADGSKVDLMYDGLGRTVSQIDAQGRVMRLKYDENSRVLETSVVDGPVTNYEYDMNGNLLLVRDTLGILASYAYDPLGRLIRHTDGLGGHTTFEYDALGNLISETDRNGRERIFAVDAESRVTSEKWWANESMIAEFTFNYDAVGNLTTATGPNGEYRLSYDELNRKTQQIETRTGSTTTSRLTYNYDPAGNVVSVVDETGSRVLSSYSATNQLITRTLEVSPTEILKVKFDLDSTGQLLEVARFWGASPQGTRTLYSHNQLGNLTKILLVDSTDHVLDDVRYSYDTTNRVILETRGQQTKTYGYDVTNQLKTVNVAQTPLESYDYDSRGNRSVSVNSLGTRSYDINRDNRLAADSVHLFEYDSEGHLISKIEISTGNETKFEYDHRHRMISATEITSGGIVLHENTYLYDVFDRRIEIVQDGNRLVTVFDGENPWKDSVTFGAEAVTNYLYARGTDELLARHTPDGKVGWYITDRLGSVIGIVDQFEQLLNEKSYDSFGSIVSQRGEVFGDRFGFTGREFDDLTGLYYMRARFYDPQTGRFVSQDPIKLQGLDANLYRYVGNNPFRATDRTGLLPGEERPPSLSVLKTLGNKIDRARNYSDLWECFARFGFNPLNAGAGGIGGAATGLAAGGVEGAAIGAAIGGLIGAAGDLGELLICLEKLT